MKQNCLGLLKELNIKMKLSNEIRNIKYKLTKIVLCYMPTSITECNSKLNSSLQSC